MANEYTDTTAFPALTTATGKQEFIRLLLQEAFMCPTLMYLIARLNNTDLTGLTDGATIYDPADTFASAVS